MYPLAAFFHQSPDAADMAKPSPTAGAGTAVLLVAIALALLGFT
jgi:hypothetical protein